MTTKMLRPEDLQAMTNSALVAHYNQLASEHPELGYKPTERFASAAKGLYRIEALYSSIKGAAADDGREHTTTETENTEAQAAPATDGASASDETPAIEEETDMAKTKKAARKARTTAKATGSTARGFAPEAKIHIIAKENPRRGAAAERWKLYKEGMTVETYSSKFEGGRSEALVHLRWDVKAGNIKVA